MFLLLLLSSAVSLAQDPTPVAAQVLEWKIYAPGLAAPSIERQVVERVSACAEQYSVSEFDDLVFDIRATADKNVVSVEPEKLSSRAIARCSTDSLQEPFSGQPSDARGSVSVLVQIGERN